MGKYDLPAFIQFIRKTKNLDPSEKITYVGHSQGNALLFYGMLKEPEFYKKNLKGIVSLSPPARVTRINPLT